MFSRISSLIFGILLLFSVFAAPTARADGIRLVRDVEIEDIIRKMATPLFKVAGLEPSSVTIHLVESRDLNAFVADGQKLFIHTALLMRAESADQLIGVIAHEIGHMAGGHLSRFGRAADRSTATALLATILGGAAAISTGRADVGGAIIAGGQHVAARDFLSFSRSQEYSADLAALRFLDQLNLSAKGLLDFLNILGGQELLISNSQDAYVRTHPLTSDRIEVIANHIKQPDAGKNSASPETETAFKRMQAKLIGYFDPAPTTLRRFPPTDTSVPARYARAFAYAKIPDLPRALSEIDALLTPAPHDPYFLELQSQVLFESGKISEAVVAMRKAVQILPNEPLFLQELGRMLIEMQDDSVLDEAIRHLELAVGRDRRAVGAWHYLGIAYGRKNNVGMSSLALAENAMLRGDKAQARFHAGRAMTIFPRGSRQWLQAEDIQLAAQKKPAK